MSAGRDFIRGFKKGMGEFGSNINALVNSVLLTIVYLIGAGLTSVVAKIVGKEFLDLKVEKESDSYWLDLDLEGKPMDDFYRQF